MRIRLLKYFLQLIIFFCINYSNVKAQAPIDAPRDTTAFEKKDIKENKVINNDFAITFHKKNYVFPLYVTGSPYHQVYENYTPENEKIQKTEISYQISFKAPIWKDMFQSSSSIYFAYTQLSFWQAYNKMAFFRESDFEPEIFVVSKLAWPLFGNFLLDTLNVGAVHASNGAGGIEERSWNRLYIEATASNPNWIIHIRPWYVFHDSTYNRLNPDMAKYLGFGEVAISYKFLTQDVTLQGHGFFENKGRYKTASISYSYPIAPKFRGYIQAFHGYGQSLIEYDHHTNGVGLGVLLNTDI